MSSNELLNLGPGAEEAKVSPPMAISMIAMNFALKYCDISTIQEGALYQQYKLEGKNIEPLYLEYVFEVAKRIELHLLTASEEVSKMMVEGVFEAMKSIAEEEEPGDVSE